MSYALIQRNLGQTIDRKTLEDASVHVPSVARADCARIHRDLFGIVVRGLPREDAAAFQTALTHFGFLTDIVAQRDLPTLPPPQFRRGIRFHSDHFSAVDGMGREDSHPWDEVQFAAGGFTNTVVQTTKNVMEWNYSYGPHGTREKNVQITKETDDKEEKEFRLELFLSCPPYRLQFRAGQESVFRYDDLMLRARQTDQFELVLQRIGRLLPDDCLSLGILAALRHEAFIYPSPAGFEEETVWHLYRRLRH